MDEHIHTDYEEVYFYLTQKQKCQSCNKESGRRYDREIGWDSQFCIDAYYIGGKWPPNQNAI